MGCPKEKSDAEKPRRQARANAELSIQFAYGKYFSQEAEAAQHGGDPSRFVLLLVDGERHVIHRVAVGGRIVRFCFGNGAATNHEFERLL
jgi:hypothetical protein